MRTPESRSQQTRRDSRERPALNPSAVSAYPAKLARYAGEGRMNPREYVRLVPADTVVKVAEASRAQITQVSEL